jgi:TetR/AcrR family transcriptional repressor of nem operon
MIGIIQSAMRASKSEKAATHERIVQEAATQLRERGADRPGVAEIMRAAGMTHGGFYKHFDSRDALVAEATERAMTENAPAIEAIISEAEDPLAAFVDWYVSEAHRDDPGHGCGVVALANDAPRSDAIQAAYRTQIERYLNLLADLLGSKDPDSRAQAAVTLSTLVGAVLIARALGDTPVSDQLLADVRDAVRERRSMPAR